MLTSNFYNAQEASAAKRMEAQEKRTCLKASHCPQETRSLEEIRFIYMLLSDKVARDVSSAK